MAFNRSPKPVEELVKENAIAAADLQDLASKLGKPRAIWLMVPAAAVDKVIADLVPHLESGDILIDGGNSYYVDDIRRAKELAPKGIHYVDVGTSGGVWGLERGYCLMIGGEADVVKHLDPIFKSLAPGVATSRAHPDAKSSTAPPNWVICTVVQMAPVTSSRWSTTELSTASWRPTPKVWAYCAMQTSANKSGHRRGDDAVAQTRSITNTT